MHSNVQYNKKLICYRGIKNAGGGGQNRIDTKSFIVSMLERFGMNCQIFVS